MRPVHPCARHASSWPNTQATQRHNYLFRRAIDGRPNGFAITCITADRSGTADRAGGRGATLAAIPRRLRVWAADSVGGRMQDSNARGVASSTLRRRAHGLGGPAGDGEAGTRLDGRVCLDEGFYLHRQGSAGVSSQIMSAAVRGRSSGPSQPAAGISALSTETMCGPKLRPLRCPPPPSRHKGLASSQVSGGGGGI